MKVIVDRTRCAGLGICESVAPDVFEVNESGELELLTETISEDQLADVQVAVNGCPTDALRLER